MIRGTGPRSVPASVVKLPAWIEGDGRAAAEVGAPVGARVDGHLQLRGPPLERRRLASKSRKAPDAVGVDWPW